MEQENIELVPELGYVEILQTPFTAPKQYFPAVRPDRDPDEPKKKGTKIQTIADGKGKRYHIPPRKEPKFQDNLVLRFVIAGTIPSKKNCQVPVANKRKVEGILNRKFGQTIDKVLIDEILAVKPFIRRSARYNKWEDRVRDDLVLQAARWIDSYASKELKFPIKKASIAIYHYWADPKERDNSNKAESIHDALVACGIILKDSSNCLYKTAAEAGLYRDELNKHLTIFTITAHEW